MLRAGLRMDPWECDVGRGMSKGRGGACEQGGPSDLRLVTGKLFSAGGPGAHNMIKIRN